MFNALERRIAGSIDKRKEIFVIELLRSGVEPQTAMEVARIVADAILDEQLSCEQAQLVKVACAAWLKGRKRQQFVDEVLQSFAS